MDIYAASDGYVLQLTRGLSEFASVDELAHEVAHHLGLDTENILLFLEDGREVKDRVLLEALDRGGSGEGSNPKSEVMYLFNRETFWTDAEEWADKYKEDVFYPPQLDPGAISDIATAQEPLLMAHDHMLHVLSLFQAQYRALSLAYQNLEHHLQPLRDEWDKLSGVAATQLREQEALLDSAPSDLLLLPKVTIHPTFWSKRDQAGNMISRAKDEAKEKTLADYIHSRKMEEVMEACRISHDDLQTRFLQIATQMDDLIHLSQVEKERAEESATAIQLEFDRSLQRLQDSLEYMAEAVDVDQLVEVAMSRDEIMREDLGNLTALKNDYTLDVHIHLRQVARLESRMAEVVRPLTTLETDFKSKGAFPHLSRLHELPFAYMALVLEYRWRLEFGEHFAAWCNRLGQAVVQMLAPEIKRREGMNKEILSYNPFTIHGLEDSTIPFCETTYHTGGEALKVLALDKSILTDLDDWIKRLTNDIDSNYPPGPSRDALYDVVKQHTSRYENLKCELSDQSSASLDGYWNQQVFTHMRTTSATQQAKDDEIERQHQEEIHVYHLRQEEAEQELARLRTELEDQAVARQALSAELEERNRASEDRQRDQEDHAELVAALHADIAQEKDRATDLGVRLQEALLDVDGIKNAEQILIGQLHQLRDERTKHFQQASESQTIIDNLNSQVAGLKAQLDATTRQLSDAQEERDSALRSQTAEAQRMIRDRIAEVDGDRAILEHQNANLHKELEDLKVGIEEKLNSTRNTAIRQVDGYKAELSLSKAQLRDAQRREAVLSDELAVLKDNANALSSDRSHQSEVAKDAVATVTRYYEACRPLFRLATSAASSRRPGSDEPGREDLPDQPRPLSPISAAPSSSELRESVLIRGLASAQAFDLEGFSEAITKVVTRLKRYTKGYKHMRDIARNKIAFSDFQKGDVALFLPTRDPARRHWAAFNINAPHHFLKADDRMLEEAKSRDWIMARITSSEEAIAGETGESNPLGLTTGLRYQIHGTEPFDPGAMPRLTRRSTSMGMNSMLLQDASPKQSSRIQSFTPGNAGLRDMSWTGPDAGLPNETPSGMSTSLRETVPPTMSPMAITQKPDSYFPSMPASRAPARAPSSALIDTKPVSAPEPVPVPTETTPISTTPSDEAIPSTGIVPPPSSGQTTAGRRQEPKTSPITESSATTSSSVTAVPMRTSQHRTTSRTASSPVSRDTPIFAPSSLGRPVSVASSTSPHGRGFGIPIGSSGGKTAPAMAITSSYGSGDHPPIGSVSMIEGDRRSSSSSSLTPSQREETGAIGKSPLGASTLTPSSSRGGLGLGKEVAEGGADGKITPRTISRGFSIGSFGKKRTTSSASSVVAAEKAQTAVDILKQFEDKK